MKSITFFLSIFLLLNLGAKANKYSPLQNSPKSITALNTSYFLNENFDSGIPASWTISNSTGNAQWQNVTNYNGFTLDGTAFAMIDSKNSNIGSFIDSALTSPSLNTSSANKLYISFDQFFETYLEQDQMAVEVYDGNQWITIYHNNIKKGNWGRPNHQIIDVSTYKNSNFKIRFHYNSIAWNYAWAIDNVRVFEPFQNDISVVDILPESYLPTQDFPLTAVIYNNGQASVNNFVVTFNIKDASNNLTYSNTINITDANLPSGQTYNVNSNTYPNLAAGSYTLEVDVNLANDEDTTNNAFSKALKILDYASTYTFNKVYNYAAFDSGQHGNSGYMGTFDMDNGLNTTFNTPSVDIFFTSGDFVNGILTAIEYNTNAIYFIDGDGFSYKYGYLTGDIMSSNQSVTAITYDSKLHQGFLTDGVTLYSFDQNFNTSTIGPLNNAGYMVGLAIDNHSKLYGIDANDDRLYSIDKNSGNGIPIGALGIDISYIQDMCADPTTGDLYATLFQYNSTNAIGGLYTINKPDGNASAIGIPIDDQYTICAIYGTTLSTTENAIADLKLYPNPVKNILNIDTDKLIKNISIYNLAGQKIRIIDDQMTLDLSDLSTGSYFLKITTDKSVATYQIIKK